MSTEVNANLRQQGCYGQQREYQIVNGRNVRIAIGSKAKHKVFSVPMLALAEKSRVSFHIAWAWLWLSFCSLLAIPVYVLSKSVLGFKMGAADFAVITVLAVLAIIGAVMLVLNFSRKRVFYTAYSKVPLFDIFIGRPDGDSYRKFLHVLEVSMHETRSSWNLKDDQQIAGEIRMLRRLANEGVIAQKAYNQAKDKLFALNK